MYKKYINPNQNVEQGSISLNNNNTKISEVYSFTKISSLSDNKIGVALNTKLIYINIIKYRSFNFILMKKQL